MRTTEFFYKPTPEILEMRKKREEERTKMAWDGLTPEQKAKMFEKARIMVAKFKARDAVEFARRRFFRKRNKARKWFKAPRIAKRYRALHSVPFIFGDTSVKKHFKHALIARQAIRFMYGRLRNTQLRGIRRTVIASKLLVNSTDKFFDLLERRLPILLLRFTFIPTTISAVQHILHGFVKVNGKPVTYPNYIVGDRDIIEVDYALYKSYRIPKLRMPTPRHLMGLRRFPVGIFMRSPKMCELGFPYYFKLRVLRYFVDSYK
jgi:ribosomal protein S4